jgi:xanthine dehydrogenase accessory factor
MTTSSALTDVASWLAGGRPALVGRVIDIAGFSTWPGDELIAIDDSGERRGAILGRPGSDSVARRSAELLAAGSPGLDTVSVEIHGAEVIEAGLSCGGRADVLLQPSSSIPPELWEAFAARRPVALATRVEGPTAGPASLAVEADGRWTGALEVGDPDHIAKEAAALLASGHSATRRLEDGAGVVLVECWVPAPRLVVVGGGDLAVAVTAQAALLGWETRTVDDLAGVDEGLSWGGTSTAVIVTSHDGDLDVPALRAALTRGAGYVGALGSRRTQSRRLERLAADGVGEAEVARIHKPIGLDLGGRSAAEVALAIVAEILAVRTGRDGRSLAQRTGPIHDRPGAV